jgi:hypothetical protein
MLLFMTSVVMDFDCPMFSTSAIVESEVRNIMVVKNRSLCSRYLDVAYPSRMPFYLYGTEQEVHIDHVIVQAPNAQLSASQVNVDVIEGSKSAFTAGLKNGLIAVTDTLPEHLMQPFIPDRLECFFHPGAKFNVSIYTDRRAAGCPGPGLCDELGEPIARAIITLGSNTFTDGYMINLDAPVTTSHTPKKKVKFPATASTSQDHPLFRGHTPEGWKHSYTSTGSVQSWREVWDRALAGRQFVEEDEDEDVTSSSSPDSSSLSSGLTGATTPVTEQC